MKLLDVSHHKIVRLILWGGIALAMLFPLTRSVDWNQVILREWISRVEELARGPFRLFPTVQTYIDSGIRDNALNSNLFFVLPALLLRVTGSISMAYRMTMLFIQGGTIVFAKLFFDVCFGETESWAVLLGAFLYLTCPYRWFLAFSQGDLSMLMGWTLLPLYAWAVLRLSTAEKHVWRYVILGAVILAGIGYAHFVLFGTAILLTCLWGAFGKRPAALLLPICGCILFMPGLHQLWLLAFSDRYDVWDLVGYTIMPKGYLLGDYLNVYAFRESHPGMGLGLMAGLGTVIWYRFVDSKKNDKDTMGFFSWAAVLLWLLSLRVFPWEWLQRLGRPFLKLVGAIGTPATFWGLACGCLCVPAGRALGMLIEDLSGKKS